MAKLSVTVASGAPLEVRTFHVHEGISTLFEIRLGLVSKEHGIDLEAVVGQPASFAMTSVTTGNEVQRRWDGVCSYVEQARAEPTGHSTYTATLVPKLWLLEQRTNYRIFQHVAVDAIVDTILGEWGMTAKWELQGTYLPLEYRTQYGETDLAFVRRMLEEAGIAFVLRGPVGSELVMSDMLNAGSAHRESPIDSYDSPDYSGEKAFLTQVHMAHGVRPGAYTIRDYDFRRPSYVLVGEARATPPETNYEHYVYESGAFQVEGQSGGGTPVADDKAVARRSQAVGTERAQRHLDAVRAGKRHVYFDTNVIDLEPASLFAMERHAHPALGSSTMLMMTDFQLRGSTGGAWQMAGRADFAADPFRPARITHKPEAFGVQPAVVVGRPGEEIDVDEFGRARVQFPWDREGKLDDNSSVRLRASHGWAGGGYGFIQLPRIGQEVLVGFIQGDPDQPIIVGRVFNVAQQVPYKLPDHKTRSTWMSQSSLGGGGFNEIMYEDLKGQELVYMQAEKNQRRLVKNDEMITVVNNRGKLVKANEVETTIGDRTEVTESNRIEITDLNRTRHTVTDEAALVSGNETARTEGNLTRAVMGNSDHVVAGDAKRDVRGTLHQHVGGDDNTSVDGSMSITVGKDHSSSVKARYAVEAGDEIHLNGKMNVVIESALDITLKGPGGFVRIDPSGVSIVGTLVRINSGGAAGSGDGCSPTDAEVATEATIEAPEKPEPDDVSVDRLAQ